MLIKELPMIDQPRKWNRLTIISITTSILFFPLFYLSVYLINHIFHEVFIFLMLISIGTVVFNSIALKKAKNANEKGKGFAIAGICISVINFLFVLGFYILLLIIGAQFFKPI